ncbi:MAG TPA: Gp138 family membrane-puncturing spike protein [bacterium]|nr:Gp138 family membrane-puncturing spike protein [bacterium]
MKKTLSETLVYLSKAIKESILVARTGTIENIKGKFVDVKLENGDILAEVPVMSFSKSSSVGLFLPITKGDTGTLLFYDHSLEAFQNEAIENTEERNHDLSDCLFIPGFFSESKSPDFPDNVQLKNGNMTIELSDGKIKIQGGSKEVMEIISRFMDNAINTLDSIVNDPFLIATGGGSGSHSAALKAEWILPVTGLKALLERSKTDLEGITL